MLVVVLLFFAYGLMTALGFFAAANAQTACSCDSWITTCGADKTCIKTVDALQSTGSMGTCEDKVEGQVDCNYNDGADAFAKAVGMGLSAWIGIAVGIFILVIVCPICLCCFCCAGAGAAAAKA